MVASWNSRPHKGTLSGMHGIVMDSAQCKVNTSERGLTGIITVIVILTIIIIYIRYSNKLLFNGP